MEINVAEDGPVLVVGKVDVAEDHFPLHLLHRHRMGHVLELVFGIEDGKDDVEGDGRLAQGLVDGGQTVDRAEQPT